MMQDKEWSAFVLMPFNEAFLPIYTDLIAPALEEIGFLVERADSPIGQRNILKELIRKIDQSSLIVADLTTLNANVMYELGIAHALLKPTILIIQDIEELPFDLKTYNAIPYSTQFNEVANLKIKLREVAEGLQTGKASFANPVSDFAPSVIQSPLPIREPSEEKADLNTISEEPSTWIDLVGEVHEELEIINGIIQNIANAITTVGEKMSLRTEQLNNLQTSGLPNAPAVAYKIFKVTAQDMLDYASDTENELPIFREAWHKFSNNIQQILETSVVMSDEDVEALCIFEEQLSEFQTTIMGATDSTRNFRDSINGIPDISKHLTQARKTATSAVEHLIEEFSTADSSVTRIVNIIDDMLEGYEC